MSKVICTLHGGDDSVIRSPGFRSALAAAGATAVQLNLDDSEVAGAMRFGPGELISAVVSIWTDGAPAEVVRVVGEAVTDPEPHAYRVTELVRLDPEPVGDGVRSDVLANVALLRRPAAMSREDYLEYWLLRHTAIAIRTQNTSAYVQNIVEEVLTPASPEVAAIVEEHFPMAAITDPHVFYGSRGDDEELRRRIDELMASVARFGAGDGLDLVPTSRYFWSL